MRLHFEKEVDKGWLIIKKPSASFSFQEIGAVFLFGANDSFASIELQQQGEKAEDPKEQDG
ncbi:hypothetical protein AT727_02030 [Desulfitobacterium hafniense]|uniref:Uncharacterized protein n=1 Tax=Desulfitobacterium hafniense TaxID=49338 RepID=A0A0W1JQ09_DESHA|nr:hypothetical protein [Desulfitobacterium hafniense]KTE93755.1 hypothetical protein AT727_02030 [Desulfitobacterium hafniense]